MAIKEDKIMVSNGDKPEENIFMEWKDFSKKDVFSIACMTGWGSNGQWKFNSIIPKNGEL